MPWKCLACQTEARHVGEPAASADVVRGRGQRWRPEKEPFAEPAGKTVNGYIERATGYPRVAGGSPVNQPPLNPARRTPTAT